MSCPHINRRELLGASAAGALGAALGGALSPRSSLAQTQAEASIGGAIPFEGILQAGITTPQQSHALFAVYDLEVTDRADLISLMQTISQRSRALTAGELNSPESEHAPPPDSGALGEGGDPARLTVTLGLGPGAFDRPGDPYRTAARRPNKLKRMSEFPGDNLDPVQTDGELLLQLCADDPLVAMHALRDIERSTRGALSPRVVHRGAQRIVSVDSAKGEVAGARGLLGFKDGTGNPKTGDDQLMSRLVWLGRTAHEPAWTRNGSYLVLRKIRDRIEAWDRETLDSQERLIGRRRDSGAPLDGELERHDPDYSSDGNGETTPLDSHIRRANPRLESTESQRILRRGYPYFDGYDETGLLDAGLLFACYQRDPETQFEAIKQRLSPRGAQPQGLDEYLTCVGGGYFFCPHGAKGENRFVGDELFT